MIESYGFLALALTYEDPASDQLSGLNNVDWKKLSSQTYRYFLALAVAVSVLTVAQTAQALVMSGDSGNQVRQVQVRLQELGYFTANATGNFGSLTQAAVIRFQRDAGLSADGIVGPKTLAALGLGVIISPPLDTGNTGNTGYNRNLIGLGRGDRGPGVSDLQTRLQALGYFNQQPTGNFGSVTENAVIRLQQDYNIAATGLVTEATLALLNSGLNSGQDAVFPGTTLREGQYGQEVEALQQRLQTLGFYQGVITGYFDALTAVAVQQFQRSQGIPATGVATSTTLVALNVTSVPSFPSIPTPPQTDTILRLGSHGQAVRVLQAQLQTLGYYTGIVDGVFGQSTQRAVSNFQRANRITVTGEVGPTTASYIVNATTTTQTPQFRPIPIVQNQTIPITNSLSTISLGDTGPEVRKIQRRLRELNYYNGPINGFFDNATQDALIWFQESRGVTVTGIAGPTPQTSLFNMQSVSRPATQISPVVATTPPISGASNIQQLQQRLRIQGLYNGPINGVYDSLTQQAVRQARAFYGPNADTVLFGSL